MDGTHLGLLRQTVADFPAALARAEAAANGEAATPHTLRRAAWLLVAGGDIAGAERVLHRGCLRPDDLGESWFALGLLRLASDDHAAARQAFLAAVSARHQPGPLRSDKEDRLQAWDPESNRYAVFSILYDDFQHAFACFLFPRRVRSEERQGYAFCAARACNEMRQGTAAMALLEKDHDLNGESPWFHVNLGHHHWLAGRREQADVHYAQAKALFARERLIPYHFNCGTMIWLDRPASLRILANGAPADASIGTRTWSWHLGNAANSKAGCVLLVGCDAEFFDLYFPQYLQAVLSARPDTVSGAGEVPVAVHCHLADPAPGQVAFLEQAAATLPLSFSTSVSEFRETAYYTCLRFMALPEVLRAYDSGVLVTDIDAAIEPEFFAALPSIANMDFGFRMYSFDPKTGRQIAGEPWSIGAHPTYVAATDNGRHFARFLRDYICAAYDPAATTNWTIDQCAIARGYDLLVRERPDVKLLNFAFFRRIARLAQEHPTKAAFLADRSVHTENFWDRALPFLRRGSSKPA